MKILQFAMICSIFCITGVNAGFFDSEKDANSEIQRKLTEINNQTNLSKQMAEMRSLMMKNRKAEINTTTQNAFGNALQSLFNKRDGENFRQNRYLKTMLTTASRSPLLSKKQQEYVKTYMLAELKKSVCFTDNGRLTSMLKNLTQSKNYQVRNRLLLNIVRHHGIKETSDDIKKLFVDVLKGTYAMRPLNDETKLGHLKQTLEEAIESTLLNSTDKKYVKDTLLPDVTKNIQTAKLAPQSKVFGEMKDISTAYLKDPKKDFDLSKNNFVQGPVQVAQVS
jgi:hypothetical protein